MAANAFLWSVPSLWGTALRKVHFENKPRSLLQGA